MPVVNCSGKGRQGVVALLSTKFRVKRRNEMEALAVGGNRNRGGFVTQGGDIKFLEDKKE